MAKRPTASKQRKTGIDPGGVLISHGCWCGGDVLSALEACNMGDPIKIHSQECQGVQDQICKE